MITLASLIAEYPFTLALLAAALAEASAVLLRRAAEVFGRWLWWLSGVLSLCALGGLVWSFIWAYGQASPDSVPVRPLMRMLGSIVILFGTSLAGWAVVVLGRRVFLAGPMARLETGPPYSYIRRPMGLGMALIGFGAALISGAEAVWVWYLVWLVLAQPLYELEEWELRARLPRAGDYLRRTPRYLPLASILRSKK